MATSEGTMTKLRFDFPYITSPPFSREYRQLRNVHEGSDIDTLRNFILTKMPAVADENVITTYHVLFTERTEQTPNSALRLRAIVEAQCEGRLTPECGVIEGLYEILIAGYVPATITVHRLVQGYKITSAIPPLPSVEEMYRARVAARSREAGPPPA